RWIARDPAHAGDAAPPLAEEQAAVRAIASEERRAIALLAAPDGTPAGDQYRWLFAEAGGREGDEGAWLVVFEGAGLSDAARRALPFAKLVALRSRAKRVVFDFDDSIWLRRKGEGIVPVRLPRRLRLGATVRWSDAVIAGNDFLAAWSRAIAPEVPVTVIPTP